MFFFLSSIILILRLSTYLIFPTVPLPQWAEAQHFLETCFTFDSLGGGQQQMVLRQNVSYDVYGTFCMESEEETQKTYPNMSCNSDQMFYSG